MIRKRLLLKRDQPEAERCFGSLFYRSSWLAETMEPGDADVKAPRVRPDFYHCVPHGWEPNATVRFKRTWALVGSDVSHQAEAGVPRAAILLHDGTRDEHTLGCILVGSRRGISRGEPALLEDVNGEAMERLRDLIGNNDFYLTIMGG